MAGMEQRVYVVEDNHCGNSEASIRRALDGVEGIGEVAPDHRTDEVRVAFDESRLDEGQVGELLARAGHPAKAVEPGVVDAGDRRGEGHPEADGADGLGRRTLFAFYGLLVVLWR